MTSEKREAIKSDLRRSQVPKSAPQIRKELSKQFQIPPKELLSLLESMVAAGEIFSWPQKKFWDRDIHKKAPELILEFLAANPVAPCARIKGTLKLPLELVQSTLEELVNAGRLHIWQPGVTAYYCQFDPEAVALEAIAKALAAGPLTQRELIDRLRNRLPGYQAKHLKEHILKSSRVLEHPKCGKEKIRYGLNPPEPGPYLDRAVREVIAAYRILAPCRISLDALFDALKNRLRPEKKTPFFSEKAFESESQVARRLILESMARLQPFGQKRALVSIRELRRSLNLAKADFDRAIFGLARENRVALHHHDFPNSLTSVQQDELVRDEAGTYYVGIVLKEAS
ncbi:MAG: hypothetical protein JW836_02255 [Deltaproteobacteria bacterium]|nr:hypothetical protein [Deltaproteobacteria bacterium]